MEPTSAVVSTSRKARIIPLTDLKPEQAIPYLLRNLHLALRPVIEEAFRRKRVGLSLAHYVTLYTLAAEPGVAGAELARLGFVTAQSMNAILRRLERDGYIERRPHPSSVRADSWYLTKAGQAQLDRAKVIGEGIWASVLSGLKAQEAAQLQSLLARCVSALKDQTRAVGAKEKTRNGKLTLLKR
jgi:DNA-binding MarR family transcriptional regulator